VWPLQAQPKAKAFSPFPPLAERLEALRTEIKEILPNQSTAIRNTENFSAFREHLLTLAAPLNAPKKPTLIRPDRQNLN
jgi:hypothetical protein